MGGGGPYTPPQAPPVTLRTGRYISKDMPYIWAFLRGGGHFWGFDAKWEVFRPFTEFLMDVGGPTSENMGPPYFGHGESKNQGFRLI